MHVFKLSKWGSFLFKEMLTRNNYPLLSYSSRAFLYLLVLTKQWAIMQQYNELHLKGGSTED